MVSVDGWRRVRLEKDSRAQLWKSLIGSNRCLCSRYARIHSWGSQPDRKGDYDAASPCRHVDLPQTLLEPILVKHATANGWKVRFDSTLVGYERDSSTSPVVSTIKDNITGHTYRIRSKYLFACDGARSQGELVSRTLSWLLC